MGYSMRRKKQGSKKLRVVLLFLWLVVCSLFGFFLPQIPGIKNFVQVRKVEIYGSDKIDERKIKDIFESVSWIFIDKEYVEREIKTKYPFIKGVSITVVKPGVVKVSLEERKPVAILKHRGKLYIVDSESKVFPIAVFQKFPLKKINTYIIDNDEKIEYRDIKNINLIKTTLNTFKIKKYIINISQIVCVLENEKVVVFSKENLNNGIKRAKRFFNRVDISEYRYIDFSFNSIVVARR